MRDSDYTCYEVRGVAANAPLEDIRRGYRRLAKAHRPNVSGNAKTSGRNALVSTPMPAPRVVDVVPGPPGSSPISGERVTLGEAQKRCPSQPGIKGLPDRVLLPQHGIRETHNGIPEDR